MNIISFFSGCGGLDLGFEQAGFNVQWSNDNAKGVWQTFAANFPNTILNKQSIKKLKMEDIPSNATGIIGGPPCQSWSNAGKGRGIKDKRGILFFDFINIIKEKQPMFFVIENVEGLMAERNQSAFEDIKTKLDDAGYNVSIGVLNAADYSVPQNRKRIFFVGYRLDLNRKFKFPKPEPPIPTVRKAIFDLRGTAIPAKAKNQSNGDECLVPNHEYWNGSYSYIFMSRNRVLDWDKPSFTIQASGRQVSIHPQAPAMVKIKKDEMAFVAGSQHLYRRLTVRECARIQTFPDDFYFHYESLDAGYKMIGNSVPVNLARAVARAVYADMAEIININPCEANMVLRQQQPALC